MSDHEPNVEWVLDQLKAGAEFQAGGGRYYQVFKWQDGKLISHTFDEGTWFDEDVTIEQLVKALRDYPDRFPTK